MHRRRFIGTALATVSTIAVAGCGSSGGGGGANETTESDQTETTTKAGGGSTVVADGSQFKPLRLSVDPGTEVQWQNKDSYSHTVDAAQFHDKAKQWDKSQRISANGGQASHTFEEPGVYEYFCKVHGKSKMCGAVLVGDVSLDASLPCEDGGGG